MLRERGATAAAARDIYGVAVDATTGTVDLATTKRLRGEVAAAAE